MNGADGEPFPMDNAMIADSSLSPLDPPAGAAGGGAKAPPPSDYIAPDVASAILRGAPEPIADIYEIDTSCDDSDDGDEQQQQQQQTLDDMFSGAAGVGANAYAECGSRRRGGRRRRRAKSRIECFGCSIALGHGSGASDATIEKSKIARLVQLFCDQAPRLERWTLARMLHLFYKESIYLPLKRTGKRVPMWHTHEIYVHFYHHGYSPEVYLMNQIDEYTELSHLLYKAAATRTSGGSGAMPDLKVIATKIRVDQLLDKLRRGKPDEYSFHNSDVTIDLEEGGKPVSGHGSFKVWG